MADPVTVPRPLSRREEEIVQLSIEGFTNEAVAQKLGLSVGTVNTYWMRIRFKVGGCGRTDTVAKILSSRAEKAISAAELRQADSRVVSDSKTSIGVEAQAALSMLRIVASQCRTIVWAVDRNLIILLAERGEAMTSGFDSCEAGNSIRDVFESNDPGGKVVQAHIEAVSGTETEVKLNDLTLRAIPLRNDADEVLGCIGIATSNEASIESLAGTEAESRRRGL